MLQPILVRPKGSLYELLVGERSLRASALVGLDTIEADVKDVDDATAMEMRLTENCHREDLTETEKGDAILLLWAKCEKHSTLTKVGKAIGFPYETVRLWTWKARKLAPAVKIALRSQRILEAHALHLMKYSHAEQVRLLNAIEKHEIRTSKLRQFLKFYDSDPTQDIDDLARKAVGAEFQVIPRSMLTEE